MKHEIWRLLEALHFEVLHEQHDVGPSKNATWMHCTNLALSHASLRRAYISHMYVH